MARARKERPADPDRLVRRSAGDLHSEDGRFEVSSTGGAGRWYVTDTERHDGLGLALVLGPFGTLDEVRAAIVGQRELPAGDDGPLPEPAMPAASSGPRRGRRSAAEPAPEPPPEPEPEPEPEPPSRPPVRIDRARWRHRGDERDAVLEAIRRITGAWLDGDPDAMGDDLRASMVALMPDADTRLEGRDKVMGAFRDLASQTPAIAWREHDLTVDLVGPSAVVRYRYELDRDVDGATASEHGWDLWVLAREDDRWLAVWRLMTPDEDA
jgi:hypothetical protein